MERRNVLNIINIQIFYLNIFRGQPEAMVEGRNVQNILNILSLKHITWSTWRDVGREKRGGGGGRVGPPREESVRPSHRLRLLELDFDQQKAAQRLWVFLVAFYA